LGDLPVIGNLFRNTHRSQIKSELVILLKPTVIEADESWKQDLQDASNRIRDLRHDDFSRYWKEEVLRQRNEESKAQPDAEK
jgi:type II secretory pathway component GspD/PulD (secretin)